MISKTPDRGDKTPEQWIDEFRSYFERVRFEFIRVRGLWFPAQSSEQHGDHPGDQIILGTSAFISAVIPRGTNQIRQAVIRLIPTASGTIDWTANLSSGGLGQDESANTATLTAIDRAVVDDEITEIEVTDLFASVSPDDQVGLEFILDAATTTTDVYVLGLYLKLR